jgi:hypothetical protein
VNSGESPKKTIWQLKSKQPVLVRKLTKDRVLILIMTGSMKKGLRMVKANRFCCVRGLRSSV